MTTGGEGGMLVTDDHAAVGARVVVQGPRQELRRGVQPRAPAGLSLAARVVRHQLAHDRDAGGDRPAPARQAAGAGSPRAGATRSCSTRELAGVAGPRARARAAHRGHAYYKYYAFVDPARLAAGLEPASASSKRSTRKAFPALEGSCSEMYLEKAFVGRGSRARPSALPVARALGETSLMFMVHPTHERARRARHRGRDPQGHGGGGAALKPIDAPRLSRFPPRRRRSGGRRGASRTGCASTWRSRRTTTQVMWQTLLWVVPLQALVFWSFGLYRGIWRYASLQDLKRLLRRGRRRLADRARAALRRHVCRPRCRARCCCSTRSCCCSS